MDSDPTQLGFLAVLTILAGAHQNPMSIAGTLLLTMTGGTIIGAVVGPITGPGAPPLR
jgi:hypothetical protein